MNGERVRRGVVASLAPAVVLAAAALTGGPAMAAAAPAAAGGPAPKTVTIALDLPMQGAAAAVSADTVNAVQLYLNQIGHRAGRYRVTLRSYDHSAPGGNWDPTRCAGNAKRHVAAKDEVVVIGPYNSGCAKVMLPVLNRDRTGPLVMISHATSNPGLTVPFEKGEPKKYYPTGKRNFARLMARDDAQGVAAAKYAATTLRTRRVFVLDDGSTYGRGVAAAFAAAATKSKVTVVGSAHWAPGAPNYTTLFQQIKAKRPDTLYLGGVFDNNGKRLLQDKAAVLGDNHTVRVIGADGLTGYPELNALPEADGLFATYPGVDGAVLYSRANGKRFMEAFKATYGSYPATYAVYGVAAVQEGLAALAKSDGTRKGVQKALFSGRGTGVPASASVLGIPLGVDPKTGDVTVREITVEVVTGGVEQRVSLVTMK